MRTCDHQCFQYIYAIQCSVITLRMIEHKELGPIDFAIFGLSLALSISVGIFYTFRERHLSKQRAIGQHASSKTMDYLVGGRDLPVAPVMLSVLTTFLSGISLLGTPAEMYQRGALFWVWYMTAPLALLFSGYFFVPIFFQFRPISIYEYFELRFKSKVIRKIAAALFLLNSLFYMAVVMYAPAVALSGVTNVETWPLIVTVAVICTFYTTLGGLKAVVWTDTIQAVFMYTGVITVIVMGVSASGGMSEIWRTSSDLGRFTPLTYFNPDPAQYCSMWTALFGGFGYWTALYGLNQMAMQRYCNLATLRQSYTVIGVTIPCFVVLGSMCCFVGLVMLAFFKDCDPLVSGDVQTKDQLVILMVVDTLGMYPGLSGIFVACLFSGTLSTISSGINSMAAVTWEDFLKGSFGHLSDNKTALLSKLMTVTYGFLAMGLAFAAGPLGGLVNSALTVMGAISGPLLGLFFLGVFVPKANKHGALFGALLTMTLFVWIAVGNITNGMYMNYSLPMNNSACLYANVSNNTQFSSNYGDESVFYMYRISTFIYGIVGLGVTFVVGTLVSLLMPIKEDPDVIEKPNDASNFVLTCQFKLPWGKNDVETTFF